MPEYVPGHGLLKDKVVVVTAAAGTGIGFATAKKAQEEGATVIVSDWHERRLSETAEQLGVQGVVCDVTQQDQVDALVSAAVEAHGRLDVMVNNAGLGGTAELVDMTDEQWLRVLDVTLNGTFRCTRAALQQMKTQGSGVIVNIIGSAGERFPPAYIAGATGNASLMAFTRALGRASSADGIRVVAINPAGTETDRHIMLLRDQAQRQFGDPERWRELDKKLPFGRAAHPSEIAYAAAFLASPRSGYTSGTVLTIDGGG